MNVYYMFVKIMEFVKILMEVLYVIVLVVLEDWVVMKVCSVFLEIYLV